MPSAASLGLSTPDRVAIVAVTSAGGAVATLGAGTRAPRKRPAASTAAHSPPGKQETPLSFTPGSALEPLQIGSAPPGASLASAWPRSSTATHTPDEAPEAAPRCPPASIGGGLPLAAPQPALPPAR